MHGQRPDSCVNRSASLFVSTAVQTVGACAVPTPIWLFLKSLLAWMMMSELEFNYRLSFVVFIDALSGTLRPFDPWDKSL